MLKEKFEFNNGDKILNLKIEKGIPVPPINRKCVSILYEIAPKMEVGDSIEFPDFKSSQKLTRVLKKLNLGFTCRKITNGHYRIFRQ